MPTESGGTRLIVRERASNSHPTALSRVSSAVYNWLIWDPMHFTMQHRMLLGLQTRAEGNLDNHALLRWTARGGWVVAGLATVLCFVWMRRSIWLLLPALVTVPALVWGHDAVAALAGFLAVGITLAAALRWGSRWWPALALLGAGVLLVLLLTADAFLAFGLMFAAALVVGAAFWAWLKLTAVSGETSTQPHGVRS